MKRQHRTDSNRETKWKLNDRSDHCDSHSTRSCVFGLVVTSLRRRVKLKPVQLLKRVSRPQQRPVYKGKNASGVNGVSHSVRVGFSFSPSEDHNKHTANISVICSRVFTAAGRASSRLYTYRIPLSERERAFPAP